MNNMLNGMFGKVAHGMCRLSMSGGIAVSTSHGYKSYNIKTGRLTNCSNFVFDIGEDFFFVIPTNKVEKGDIILVSGKPKCVIEVEKNKLTVINYEDSTVETILPERHVFMGSTYFYGKIVSMFGSNLTKGSDKKKKGNNIMKYMMMSELFKGAGPQQSSSDGNPMSSFNPMAMAMMMGGGSDMFSDIFDFEDDDEDEEKEDTNTSGTDNEED